MTAAGVSQIFSLLKLQAMVPGFARKILFFSPLGHSKLTAEFRVFSPPSLLLPDPTLPLAHLAPPAPTHTLRPTSHPPHLSLRTIPPHYAPPCLVPNPPTLLWGIRRCRVNVSSSPLPSTTPAHERPHRTPLSLRPHPSRPGHNSHSARNLPPPSLWIYIYVLCMCTYICICTVST